MAYKQINDEAARELRSLLVQAGETADRTRREARAALQSEVERLEVLGEALRFILGELEEGGSD